MTPSLAQQTFTKLKALLPRWYAAKESVGIDILHALRGQEGDDFGGLFAMVELLQASEQERERLVAANGQLRRELSYEGDQRERAEKAEAALQASEQDLRRLHQGLRERGLYLPDEDPITGALNSLDEWMGYARRDAAKLASLERGGKEDQSSVACGLTPVSLPRQTDNGSATPLSVGHYAALGVACESHGLGWYAEDGTMRFQPPADMIEERAYKKGWNDREADILERAARILPEGAAHD